MKKVLYILVSCVMMAMSAFTANAGESCDVGSISSVEDTDLFAYNAVLQTVEYLSEQSTFILLSRNSSSQGVLRQLETRRHSSSVNKSLLLQAKSKTLAIVRESGFQMSGAISGGVRSVSELIYIFRTIII